MTDGFFQFNNSIINEITDFTKSNFHLLFVNGKKGTAKSDIVEKALSNLSETKLIFKQFCFSNTTIDDFLLNFYDALRDFSLSQHFSLKKLETNNFKEKIIHYFKLIPKECLIVVENFENIDENVEIIDFLSHLTSFNNVKIIIITRNGEKNLFRFKKIKIQNLSIKPISKEDFKSELVILSQPLNDELQEKFYEITNGLELYLKMSAKFCAVTETSIPELIREYERKHKNYNLGYEEFLISKFVTLIPKVYQNFLKTLSAFAIPVNKELIENYKLTSTKDAIDYLSKNYLVSFFGKSVYVKDYFKKYITKSYSLQEKLTYYTEYIEILEKELEKSPKDRLIRLSRESIRREIEETKAILPAISSSKSSNAFSYLGISSNGWQDDKLRAKSKLAEKFAKIRERKNLLLKQVESEEKTVQNNETQVPIDNYEEIKQNIVSLINSSRELNSSYKYAEAISELKEALTLDIKCEFRIEILILIGKNYEFLNEYDLCKNIYKQAHEIAIENKDERKAEIEFLIAQTDENTYKLAEAKVGFNQIVVNESNPVKYRRNSYFSLAEIYEAEQNYENAINCYNNAIQLSLGKDKKALCRAYYKIGYLYDELGDWDNAVKFYQKNYLTSSETYENKYYSASLANLASIYNETSQYKDAITCLKLALDFELENGDLENLFLTQKGLADIYSKFNEENLISYSKKALHTAQQLNDKFKQALVYFGVAQYYYNNLKNELALMNFLKAKKLINGIQSEENERKINQRINELKSKLDKSTFDMIVDKYGK